MKTKFRACDKEVKHMYYPPNHHIVLEMTGKCLNLQNGCYLVPLFWTGLLDRHGKEIWEGDIVFNADCNGKHEVKWFVENGGVMLGIECSSPIKAEFWEVIGNIYEHGDLIANQNPELGG